MSKNISKICINNDNHLTYLYTNIFLEGIPFVFCDQWLTYAQIFLSFCNHNFGHCPRSLQATKVFSQNPVFWTYFSLEVIFDIPFNWNYWLAYFFSQSLVYLWICSKPMSLLFCFYNCTKINVLNYQTLPFKFMENRMKLIQKHLIPFLHSSVLFVLFFFHPIFQCA